LNPRSHEKKAKKLDSFFLAGSFCLFQAYAASYDAQQKKWLLLMVK